MKYKRNKIFEFEFEFELVLPGSGMASIYETSCICNQILMIIFILNPSLSASKPGTGLLSVQESRIGNFKNTISVAGLCRFPAR